MIEKAIEKDINMTSFDFVSMYHQKSLTEETAEYFCFKYNDKKVGKVRYFKWKVLAFGNKARVDITKKILKPFVELVRKN